MYSLSDFNFELPPDLIAQFPLPQRTESRLLHVTNREFFDRKFVDILDQCSAGDVLVFNDTRVLKARFFGVKETGGKIELLIERILDEHNAHVQIRASKSPQVGSVIRLFDAFNVRVADKVGNFYTVYCASNLLDMIETYGRLPLPPYIEHCPDAVDEERYQTVYAKELGAVAAPTAGLHFDRALLRQLQDKGVQLAYVTLHVGAGTYQPVRSESLAGHQMHREWYSIPVETVEMIQTAKKNEHQIIAVGTTSLRALESASQKNELLAGAADTALFITPGYVFQTVTRLITNFHLPKSTLLMLVSAFAGYDQIRAAYQYAIEQRYRFFSYGDAMLLDTNKKRTA